jgi:PncC family amidohydrolase
VESVTAGCLQTELSNIKDARDFFQGGITTYNCGQKARHLNIDPIFANNCNAVDPDIAVAMAKAACHLFCSQIGLSATGYASPEGAIRQPFAYFAIVYNSVVLLSGSITADTHHYGIGVQTEYAQKILEALSGILKDGVFV